MLPECVIFDLDGTLCDVSSIRYLVAKGLKDRNFHAFHMESTGCPPIDQAAKLWHQHADKKRVIVTARDMKYYYPSLWWLLLNGFEPDDMFMRGWKDQRKDGIVKEEILAKIRQRYTPVLAVDDNPEVIEVWQRNGIETITIPGWVDFD